MAKDIKKGDELIYSQLWQNKNYMTYFTYWFGVYNEITDSIMWLNLLNVF